MSGDLRLLAAVVAGLSLAGLVAGIVWPRVRPWLRRRAQVWLATTRPPARLYDRDREPVCDAHRPPLDQTGDA